MSRFTRRDLKWTNNHSYFRKLRWKLEDDMYWDCYPRVYHDNDYRCWKRYRRYQFRN